MSPVSLPSRRLKRTAAICAFLSGIAATLGIIFLFIFYSSISTVDVLVAGHFGTLNDIAVIVQYTLMLPISAVLYQLLRPGRFPVQAGIDLEYRLLTKSLA